MRYIKKFESEFLDEYKKKMDEYKNYLNKFIIFKYENQDILYIGKLLRIELITGYYIEIETYDYDYFEKGYNVIRMDPLHITDIDIIFASDKFSEIKKEYKILLDSNKYNL